MLYDDEMDLPKPGTTISFQGHTWNVLKRIYEGVFSHVYMLRDVNDKRKLYAMKVEKQHGCERPVLKLDVAVLSQMRNVIGFPNMIVAGRTENFKNSMKSVLIIVPTLVTLVVAELDFISWVKEKKDDDCKDNEPAYCEKAVPLGFCWSTKRTEVKEKCMKSCHMCCGDRDKNRCEKYKEEYPNFCNSSSVTVEELKMVCGETCHLCNDDRSFLSN